jgi:D-beta-D-heptose 7-phosphate kinase/D-beta-D-heptose 1-phosphate adenosyltransferase
VLFNSFVLQASSVIFNSFSRGCYAKISTLTQTKKQMPAENTFTDYKITAFSEIAEQVRKWRKAGRSLVFTNGCFDLLHAGHIRYLQTAAAFADIFILGLNSDASVHKLKGLRRPIMSQGDRALLLSALEAIDCVVIFDEETPERLIETVLPDVLVKGGDYIAEDIVGYQTVTKNGGRVEVVSFVEGKSTTGIVNLIMEQA